MSECKQAQSHEQQIAELKDSRLPKTEREHAAVREIERLEQRLAEAEAKIPRWIPVSEGLPPPIGRWPSVYGSEWVIASYRWNGAVFIGECRFVHGKKQAWKTSNDDYDIEVTHWMPLPEPPESGKGE